MPQDNFDHFETDDSELEALMADLGLEALAEDPDWQVLDPWLLDESFDE